MNEKMNILLVSEDELMINQLSNVFADEADLESVTFRELRTEFDRLEPDLVFIVQTEDEGACVDAIEYCIGENPASVVVFIATYQDFNLLRTVTRAGAMDFFIFPDEWTLFNGRVDSILHMVRERKKQLIETSATNQSFKRGRGQIFSFYSGKGGSGRTLISTTFAQTLKFESTAQVLLLDLNLQYGGVETFLSIDSNRSVAHLIPVIEELNEGHIRNVTEREPYSKLEILLSPRDAETAESFTDAFFSKLLRTCRRSYDFVIVDLPTAMNEHTYTALEESDKIFYVLNLDTPAISMLKQVENLFTRLGIDMNERMQIILNEVGRDNEINPRDIKEIIKYPIQAQLRRDIKGVQMHINKSEPLRKEMNEKKIIPFAKDIRKWVLGMIE
ncbi:MULTISPECIES: AAA family ATPase [Sutcliffiella]|uniref:Pilus assembly protein CpaE n=1 Tax=Sutcliffiella cohnii TaxID=33932 RepID=A0A223KXN3_9BACI|nr:MULTISPECIES: AAA family ATPase [Sutcliffiella]AST94164.1 pilus assembly protein CpaE [Sutcliffiella cohnii]MED4017636.1 AAA family ATPase [Sutcliffiella cohnii]WBL15379.1 AAA family ATPase [Sutcliffiella sp. NC1]